MQQVQERRLAEQEQRDAERAYQEALLSRDRRALQLEDGERECRRRLNEATARFNRALVSQFIRRAVVAGVCSGCLGIFFFPPDRLTLGGLCVSFEILNYEVTLPIPFMGNFCAIREKINFF